MAASQKEMKKQHNEEKAITITSDGIKEPLIDHLPIKALGLFARTSKTLRDDFQARLNKEAAHKLGQYIVYGDEENAKTMLEANPRLLLQTVTVEDYSNRTITGKPFQLALGAVDKAMWQMMMPYLEGLKKGEALKQFNSQFPEGIEDTSAGELQHMYDALAKAIIINDEEDGGTKEIEAFRVEITKNDKITTGKHFNEQHLVAVLNSYINNFDALETWDNRDKFWCQVVGYVQRQMPTNTAQAHCSGLSRVNDNGGVLLSRGRDYQYGGSFPSRGTSEGLGFDFALDAVSCVGFRHSGADRDVLQRGMYASTYRCGGWGELLCALCRLGPVAKLTNYVNQNQQALSDFGSLLNQGSLLTQGSLTHAL